MNHDLENLVVIAAGGGNDVFSAISYINAHKSTKNYKKIVLFGILGFTPFHTNDPIKVNHINIEDPIIIPTEFTKRYIVMHQPKEIFANESMLPTIIKTISPYINHYACISPKYSALTQSQNIRTLLLEWELSESNTMIEVVDFGGDILTNGEQSSIISPELDAFSLAIVRNLPEYKSRIAVCFPGVDGEIDKSYLTSMCNPISSKHLINSEEINSNIWISQLKILFDILKQTRPGNTIPNMINVLENIIDNNNTTPSCKISKTFTIGKNKYNFTKFVEINMSLQNKIHYFNINIENPFVDVYNSKTYDLMMVFKNLLNIYNKQIINDESVQMSDFHLQYLRLDKDNLYTNKHLIYNDENSIDKQNQIVIFINLIPLPLCKDDKNKCLKNIENLQTYNALFTVK
jgi:hypothetical protein